MIGEESFFTSLKNYNGGAVTFGDEILAHVKGKGSIFIPGCPKLDGILYVDVLNKEEKVNKEIIR